MKAYGLPRGYDINPAPKSATVNLRGKGGDIHSSRRKSGSKRTSRRLFKKIERQVTRRQIQEELAQVSIIEREDHVYDSDVYEGWDDTYNGEDFDWREDWHQYNGQESNNFTDEDLEYGFYDYRDQEYEDEQLLRAARELLATTEAIHAGGGDAAWQRHFRALEKFNTFSSHR